MRIHVEDVVNLCKADAVFPDDLEAIQNTIDYYCIEIPSEKTEEIIKFCKFSNIHREYWDPTYLEDIDGEIDAMISLIKERRNKRVP